MPTPAAPTPAEIAATWRAYYDGCIKAGFDSSQAFELVKIWLAIQKPA